MPTITSPSGLQYEDLTVGDGATARAGQTVTVHYTGWLTDGTKFDSSVDRNEPFAFGLGGGQVIAGWDEGCRACASAASASSRSPRPGYGPWGAGDVIPPDATLVFEVRLLALD